MRALCGAILAAGAFIGLGLTALAIGTRYNLERVVDGEGKPIILHLGDVDRPLIFALVFLTCAAIVGLTIAFMGLAYHHQRREREHQMERDRMSSLQRTTV